MLSFGDRDEESGVLEESATLPLKSGMQGTGGDENLFGEVPKVSLTWENICFSASSATEKDKKILSNVSGYIENGKILAIIGPSGAGKTTFLQILSGCMIASSGEIYYNGEIKPNTCNDGFNSDIMGYNGNAAFITQELTLHGSLTVRETLYYASLLKYNNKNGINNGMKKKDIINERVDKLLTYLGLSHVENTIIGNSFVKGISGGEKKRVSIGCELVTQKSLLFLDEPTSGLDATATNQLFFLLHKLTLLGHSIIITIHQPSSYIFKLLSEWQDYLMILSQGRTMYFGLCNKSISFFDSINYNIPSHTNPFEFYLDCVNSNFVNASYDDNTTKKIDNENNTNINPNPNYIHEQFNKLLLKYIENDMKEINNFDDNNNNNNNNNKMISYSSKPNPFNIQLNVLIQRNFKNYLRNPFIYIIRILAYCQVTFCLGLVLYNVGEDERDVSDRVTAIYFIVVFCGYLSTAAVPVFCQERVIFIRERMNGHYDSLAYSISHFVSRVPFIFMLAFLSSLILCLLIEWNSNLDFEYFFMYCMAFFALLLVSESLMVMLSAVFKKLMVALAASMTAYSTMSIAAGFFRPHSMPIEWIVIKYISILSYPFRILLKTEFKHLNFDNNNESYEESNDVLQRYNVNTSNMAIDFTILLVFVAIYEFMFFVALKFNNRVAY